jgi:hypothetical protein
MFKAEKIEESIVRQTEDPVEVALGVFASMRPDELLGVVESQYVIAAQTLAKKEQVHFFLAESTRAGGRYAAQALLDPVSNTAFVEMPGGGDLQKGRLPGVIHAIRSIPVAMQLAGDSRIPTLHFLSQEEFSSRVNMSEKRPAVAAIPLVASPAYADVFEFHTQAEKISPEAVARGFYALIHDDTELAEHKLRYAMLVTGKTPSHKSEVHLSVMPVGEVKELSRGLLNMARIKTWGDPGARFVTVRR